ncbi:class F sortase [Micromonospora profundi]|uniref:Class F sortase n=1 Tax=Micromonospora profundi TaxID=1420889 RepID=A0AAJ6I0V5_9ACTN|nr:class F sortase [Micromonospora profundi]WLS48549.1 class F sortase [Micromonospora profundi]
MAPAAAHDLVSAGRAATATNGPVSAGRAAHDAVSAGPGLAIRRHRDRRAPVAALVAAGAAVCLTLGAGVGLVTGAGRADPGRPPAARWHPGCTDGCPSVAAAPAPQGPPTRVRMPRIDIDSPLTVLGLDSAGALVPPADFDTAGWYGGGPAPGDTGPAVLAGHLDSRRGPAVFARLDELRPGDLVQVWRGGQQLSFRVTGSLRTRKNEFPTALVYGPTPGAELRLVTCGGDFDRRRGHYRDNVVVFAISVAADPALPESSAARQP